MQTAEEHKASPLAPCFTSSFGGLWPDRWDAHQLLAQKIQQGVVTPNEGELLRDWIANGYVLLPSAVAGQVIDKLLADVDRYWHGDQPFIRIEEGASNCVDPTSALRRKTGGTLKDAHYFSEAARKAIFSEKIGRVIRLVFERDILAFQSSFFEHGVQQGLRQGSVSVGLSSPLEMITSWIALEDMNAHAGGATINFSKGDALLWHANLAYGESTVSNTSPRTTRRSLATRYCPYEIVPDYFASLEHRARVHSHDGYYYSSSEYQPSDQTFHLITAESEFARPSNRPLSVFLRTIK